MDISGVVKTVQKTIIDNSPTILAGTAIAGVISTAFFAARGGMKAGRELAIRDQETRLAGFTKREQFVDDLKHTWRFYVPAGISGATTIAAVVGSATIANKRNAALLSLYTISETALKEYKDKVAETFGATKEQKVTDAIAQDSVLKDPPPSREVIVGKGEVLFKDGISGRYFMTDMESVRRAQNDLNKDILGGEGSASLNSFYEAIGLESTSFGSEVGWSLDNLLEINFSSAITEDGRPCVVIGYKSFPIRDFWQLY